MAFLVFISLINADRVDPQNDIAVRMSELAQCRFKVRNNWQDERDVMCDDLD
jgi:hypothetical protein